MKKTAVLIYNSFCYFEISVALEVLALSGKPITVFGRTLEPIKSEDGLSIIPDKTIDDLDINEYDSLILPGAMDIREAIEDKAILDFIRKFEGMIVGAISIAPILLVRINWLSGKPFMAGVNREELLEEDFTEKDLELMIGWFDSLKNPVEDGYIITDNIITSVSYNFVRWGLAFGKMLGLNISPKSFGIG